MSGHNKWSSIKHRKGAQDAKRGKLFTKIVKEITIAARSGGGNPTGNARLRRALDVARINNVPADNIQRAIKKGTGELEGVQYEELVYEGVGPAGILCVVEAVTDNRNRTAPEIRKIFERHGGSLGSSGSAIWAFDQLGVLRIERGVLSEEALFEAAVEAGANDVQDDDETWVVVTPRDKLEEVRSVLEARNITVLEGELNYLPKIGKSLDHATSEQLIVLLENLEDHDDVQRVACEWSAEDA